MNMSSRMCYYCKHHIPASNFHKHLKECSKNHNKRPQKVINNQNVWECNVCTFCNPSTFSNCGICSAPNPNILAGSYWQCQSCIFVNSIMSAECKVCSNPQPKPQQQQQHPPLPPPPQETDDATAALIAQIIAAELCGKCKKNQGFELPCGDNLCVTCAKRYLLSGIATMKWEKQALVCPTCNSGSIPSSILKECGLGIDIQKRLQEMQNKYMNMIESDPSITIISCPKCKMTYLQNLKSINMNEKDPNAHVQHKAKYRFQCAKVGCKTIFCSSCSSVPYHTGYTCQQYKTYKDSTKCRFCQVPLTLRAGNSSSMNMSICNSVECIENSKIVCNVKFECGHYCIGLNGQKCFGCLNRKCIGKNAECADDDYCNLCWVDPLSAAATVKLNCGHYFHYICLKRRIERNWTNSRINFWFLNCPLCKTSMSGHSFWSNQDQYNKFSIPIYIKYIEVIVFNNQTFIPNGIVLMIDKYFVIEDITKPYVKLQEKVREMALIIAKNKGLDRDERLKCPDFFFFNDLEKFAMDRYSFSLCYNCKNPYYAGSYHDEDYGLWVAEEYRKEYLLCGSCVINDGRNYSFKVATQSRTKCEIHGNKYIKFKCKFCCSVAKWFCWGSTHFCHKCFKKQERGDDMVRKAIYDLPECRGISKCPLGYIEHPPNGASEYLLGCIVCICTN